MFAGGIRNDNAVKYCDGDSSHSFSLGLTFAMEILLSSTKVLETYSKRWRMIFG